MDILDFLRSDGSIVVNKKLAHEIGLNEAVIYSELVSLFKYWTSRDQLTDGKWFFCTIENLQENTTLGKDAQSKAISKLEKKYELIETKRMGLPARRYFAITHKIYDLFDDKFSGKPQSDSGGGSKGKKTNEARHDQIAENPQTGFRESRKQDGKKAETNNTRINNTELRTDDDENKETRTSIREEITQLAENTPHLKSLFDHLKSEMLDPYIVQDIMTEMLDQHVIDYRLIDARNQLDYMKDQISKGESYTFFGRFFVNGLKKRSKTALDVEHENQMAQQQQAQRDTSMYYDWLNDGLDPEV